MEFFAVDPTMTLCLCMIVKNEEVNLPPCLRSVQGVVDEIVVLDTGSSDRTVEIAKEFGAKVHFFEWCNNFAIARNEALKYVESDWVLVLDADEQLAPGIGPSLKRVMQGDRQLVVNLMRQEIGAEQSPYSLVSRLFRRHPDIYFDRPYHAIVDDSVALILEREPDWQIGTLSEVAVLHEGYKPGAIAGRDKLTKARATMEGFFASHPEDPYVCSKLGALYVQMGEIPQGIELLQRGLNAKPDAPILYELHYHLGIAYNRLQQTAQAESHYQAAIAQPILPKIKLGAYNNLGNLFKAQGNVLAAQEMYHKTLQIDPTFATGYYNLGMLLKAQNQWLDAIAAYQKAIMINPDSAETYQNLGVVWLKLGKVPESLGAFRKAIALYEKRNSPEANRLRQGLKDMGFTL